MLLLLSLQIYLDVFIFILICSSDPDHADNSKKNSPSQNDPNNILARVKALVEANNSSIPHNIQNSSTNHNLNSFIFFTNPKKCNSNSAAHSNFG